MIEITVIIAVIIGLGQILKQVGVPNKFLPVISLVLGIIGGVFFGGAETMEGNIMTGLMIGLSASGLYDQTKIVKKEEDTI